MFYTTQNVPGGKLKEVTNVQYRVLKSNDISNELVWEKEKQVFMKNPNKFRCVF